MLTRSQIAKASADAQADFCLDKQPTYEVALARRIESAACAERDARIAELEQQLAEARKDAERRLDLVERVRKYPENIDHKGSLLWGDILREVERAAIKEQT